MPLSHHLSAKFKGLLLTFLTNDLNNTKFFFYLIKYIFRTFPTIRLFYYEPKCMSIPGMHLTALLSTAYHAFGGPFGLAIFTRALHRATLS